MRPPPSREPSPPPAARPPAPPRPCHGAPPPRPSRPPHPGASPGSPPRSPTAPATGPGSRSPSTARATPPSPGRSSARPRRPAARVTVLAVGSWLDTYPDLARRVLDGGHDLGNHTQRHIDVNAMTETEALAEIEACATRLRRLHRLDRHLVPALPHPARRPGRPARRPPRRIPARPLVRRRLPRLHLARRPRRRPQRHRIRPPRIRRQPALRLPGHRGRAPPPPRRPRPPRTARGHHHGAADLMAHLTQGHRAHGRLTRRSRTLLAAALLAALAGCGTGTRVTAPHP